MKYTLEIPQIVYRDIAQIETYIALDKPSAAKKVVKRITTAIRKLPENPYISFELSKKFGVDTDLLGRLVKPYIVIHDVKKTKIKVYRVFDCRSDYLSALGLANEMNDIDDE